MNSLKLNLYKLNRWWDGICSWDKRSGNVGRVFIYVILVVVCMLVIFEPENPRHKTVITRFATLSDTLVNRSELRLLENRTVELKCDIVALQIQKTKQDSAIAYQDSVILYLKTFNEIFAEEFPWIAKRVRDKMSGIDKGDSMQ
ncbi:MAG: hypothetical protein M0R17_01730 [Candidatus Omnitrophica bacterium]|jgi:hypothetical protein|nr:hypothetical protein [Candidatus Omnitrophota bacterium]